MFFFKKILLGVFSVGLFFIYSCKGLMSDYGTPIIELNTQDTLNAKIGTKPLIPLKVIGNNGGKSLHIFKDGRFIREEFISANLSEFTFEADELSESLIEGEEHSYGFVLTNMNGTDSKYITIVIKAELYDSIKVGGRKLYAIAIPENRIVKSGTTVKLVKGRHYLLSKSLTFEEGSNLVIEEGVNVFMKSDTIGSVGLKMMGQTEINGNASNPVVFTSSRMLTGSPSAGDWKTFELSGTGNSSNLGKVSYLRMEYGGKATFNLSNVGSETSIDHVQIFKSSGEGLLVTDGNVNLKYIVATDCAGSAFKLTGKYDGKIQSLISSVSDGSSAEKYQLDISETTKPNISNATILGDGQKSPNLYGIKLGSAKIYNSVVSQFAERGVSNTGANVDSTAVFSYSFIFKVKKDAFHGLAKKFEGTFAADTSGAITGNPFFNNVLSKKGDLYTFDTIPGIGMNSFIPEAEKVSLYDPSLTDSKFFSKSLFVGAVKNSSEDWTKGWVRNSDGSIR